MSFQKRGISDELSDGDESTPPSTFRASKVFGKANERYKSLLSQGAVVGKGATNQPGVGKIGLGEQSPSELVGAGIEKGKAKRRRVILEDEDDFEQPATNGVINGHQLQVRSDSAEPSLEQAEHETLVLETSEDTPVKSPKHEAGVSSKKNSSAQSRLHESEIKPGSFYKVVGASKAFSNKAAIDLSVEGHHEVRQVKDTVDVELGNGREGCEELVDDPVLHALRECEKIAADLRKQLHLAEGATEGYNKVDTAAARLVSQAEITAACAADDTGADDSPLLKPYQLIGVNFLLLLQRRNIGGAICADEMGLGKTVQAITFLGLLSQEVGNGPHLVVCPASLLENWSREFQIWCPALTVVTYHGPERADVRHSIEMERGSTPFDVLLTTYSLFERNSTLAQEDRSFLRRFDWNCVVMDEAHLLKDRTSTRTKKLRRIAEAAKCRLMLTGTPLQNDLQELWTLLNFLLPDIFRLKDLEAAGSRSGDPETQAGLIERLKTILAPFVLRRVKADVMQQLVAKIQKVETVAMHPAQGALYRSALDDYKAKVGSTGRVDKMPKKQVANIFTHLRKIANHPLLVRSKFSDADTRTLAAKLHSWGVYNAEASVDRIYEELQGNSDYELHRICEQYPGLAERSLTREDALASGKCEVLAQLLPALQTKGSRPLIFSQWTAMLDILERVLELLGLAYVRLDGSTQVSERQALVDRFNRDTNVFAFLLSTRAGGQGLNLTGADTVILHDVDFNPQVDRQAEDRCHRIGQTRPVTVYRLVSAGTVDESILKIANRKLSLDAAVLADTTKSSGDPDSKSMGEILASLLVESPT